MFIDEVAVIDEIQMIRDPSRGWAWTRALLGLYNILRNVIIIIFFFLNLNYFIILCICAGLCAEEIHVCGEPAAIDFIKELMFTTGEEVEVRL